MKKLVVLTGAGISAESGIKTFRDSGGLWEEYDIYKVASPEGWAADPSLVLEFYNKRRQDVAKAQPNAAHFALASLEDKFDVQIITQNIDDLHERAGSTNVLHLHGEIFKMRSTRDNSLIYDCPGDIKPGDKCDLGAQLRPHIVWFGEEVPLMSDATKVAQTADIFAVIGTSLAVYPAAGLVNFVPSNATVFVIDPNSPLVYGQQNIIYIKEPATTGVMKMIDQLEEQVA